MPYPYLPQPSGNPWVDSQNGGLGMLYGEQALKDNSTIEAQRAFELQRAQAGVPLNDAVMANNLAAAKRQAALDTSGETDAQAQLARDAAKSEAQGKILKNLTAAQSAQRDAVYQAADSMSQYHQTAPDASFEEANRYYQTYVRPKLLESGVKQAPPEYNLQASIDLMAQGKAALNDIKQRQQVQRIETKNLGSENVAGIRGEAAKAVAGTKADTAIEINQRKLEEAARLAEMKQALTPKATPAATNAFVHQLQTELKPFDAPIENGQQIRGLLASDVASTPQVQQALTHYLQQARTTNAQYHDMKNFGGAYERFVNTVDRWYNGEYTDKNKKLILDMLDTMDNEVFIPARERVLTAYAKRATLQGIDPEIVKTVHAGTVPPAAAPATNTPAPPMADRKPGVTQWMGHVWQTDGWH